MMITPPITFYYCNRPCKVLADLPQTCEKVIEIMSHVLYTEGDEYNQYESEPEMSTIIVNAKYVREEKIDLEKEYHQKELEFKREQTKIRVETNQILRDERDKIQKDIKELQTRASKILGMDQFLLYVEGRMNWVLFLGTYDFKLVEMKDLADKSERNERNLSLKAVCFRSVSYYNHNNRKVGDIELRISGYSDGSGSDSCACKGFETKEEAVKYAAWWLTQNKKEARREYVDFAEEHGIVIPEFVFLREKWKAEAEVERKRRVEKNKMDIEKLQKMIEKDEVSQ